MKSSNVDDQSLNLPASGNNDINNLEGALSNFRDAWQKEIASEIDKNNQLEDINGAGNSQGDIEIQARNFFMAGAENERKGCMYEAIQNYRKAVQLVPDIEFKIFDAAKKPIEDKTEDNKALSGEMENEAQDALDLETMDLCSRFQSLYSKSFTVCVPAMDLRGAHFSSLPVEIILLIFRWVVSKDLDVRSLEMCSMVCRGFYLCSRDSELWKSICNRQFGIDCCKLDNSLSWRDTFLQKPHLNFNGCYISKASYFRQGEKCFQDQFHRPWHVVEYYRYLRFFADGVVLMITTPDAPGPVLNHLRHRNPKMSSVLVGKFRLSEDHVSMVFHRSNMDQNTYRRRGRNRPLAEYVQQKYKIELSLKTPKSRSRSVLLWHKYTVFTISDYTDTMANFDLPPNKFPPFFFSRVRSYNQESESSL